MQRLQLFVIVLFALAVFGLFAGRQLTTSAQSVILGNATLSAPLGISASDGDYSNKIGVMWDAVRGAAVYRIFRNTSDEPNSAAEVGTTTANFFFDLSAVPAQTYSYWIRAENGSVHSSFSISDEGFRALGNIQSSVFSPLSPPPVPVGNSLTAAKSYLGKTLFWDEQLSSTLTVSCGTCHRPASGGSDPRTAVNDVRVQNPGFDNIFNTPDDVFGSPGVPLNNPDGTYSPSTHFGFGEQVTVRKSLSYLNAGVGFNGLFWDGRATNVFRDPLTNTILLSDWGALESQVISPPVSAVEMGHSNRNWVQVAAQIETAKPLALTTGVPRPLAAWIGGRTYPQLFEEAFGTPEVSPARIAMAIAAHERTLFSDRAPIDRWVYDIEPLTAQEIRGSEIFVTVQCIFCHGGPLLANQNFHNIGVRPQIEDIGRGAINGNSNDNGRFRTPTLRNVELRAPYMHNGRFATLEDVVEFYDRGGDFSAPNKDVRIRPLNLTAQQKADLVAFLKRPMTDPRVTAELPPFDRPTLYTESDRVPEITGTGREGTGGVLPDVVALEPPLAGNPGFTVGVSRAFGGAMSVLVIDSSDPGVGASIPSGGSFARIAVSLAGSGAGAGYGSVSIPIPNDPALIGQTFFGRWYVPDTGAINGFSVTRAFHFRIFGANTPVGEKPPADFDGDGKTDLSIFRPSEGVWWYLRSSNGGAYANQFGTSAEIMTPADFTGDGKTDIAFWRRSTGEWFILRSEDASFYSFPFGISEDIPSTGDFDADGKADQAVFRPSNATWYIRRSSDGGVTIAQFGQAGDVPAAADYDGDGKADLAIFRPSSGEWWINRSANGLVAFQFGSATDKPVPGDFTGDGKADAALFRPSSGEWFILRSEDHSFYSFPFGTAADLPAPGDYDGDGKTDAAIFRPSSANWYVNRSGGGYLIRMFGQNGDLPVPGAFIP